jgi:hypothetical protein
MCELRATRREALEEARDMDDAGREDNDAEVRADIGLRCDGFIMARDGGRADAAEEFEGTFSRAADDGLLPEARPIDVDGLRSFRAEDGREADMQEAMDGEVQGLESTFVTASYRQPF